ncbi:MAG: formylglycine-generating enzyme family protein [Oligoflexia bacterium]|nr:formylglycine-generating enzyme family protein [Oligoflexia bacterium]
MWSLVFLGKFIFLSIAFALESEGTVSIPKGKIEAIWLAPVSVSQKSSGPQIEVSAFLMHEHAVTNKQFKLFLKKHPEWEKTNANKLFVDDSYLLEFYSPQAKDNQPVTYVSWFAARAFCEHLDMRLPNINEWEYAAAASNSKRDANRESDFLKRILKWYGEPKGESIKSVKSIYQNYYGLWDMHGLIWEWVEDFNSSFVTGESREDSSFNKEMFCGAGALSSADKENYAAFMRFAFRSALKGSSGIWNLGFRCVR